MSWVWQNGPRDGLERMVLLALADHCDDAGHAFPSMAGLADKACITERGARKVMRRLEAGGWVKTAIGGGRGGKSRYQILTENPERDTGNDKPGMTNPEHESTKPGTGVHKTRNSGSPEPSYNHQEPSLRRTPLTSPRDGFDEFWLAYPRKVGKDAARAAWAKAVKRAPVGEIISGLHGFCVSARGADTQFIPHPSTWLNQGRWQDDQSHARNGPRSSSEDLRNLATISAADDLARLMGPPLKAISR